VAVYWKLDYKLPTTNYSFDSSRCDFFF